MLQQLHLLTLHLQLPGASEDVQSLRILHARKVSPFHRIFLHPHTSWKNALFRRLISPSTSNNNYIFFPQVHDTILVKILVWHLCRKMLSITDGLKDNHRWSFLQHSLTVMGNCYYHHTDSFKKFIRHPPAQRYKNLPKLRDVLTAMAQCDNACHLDITSGKISDCFEEWIIRTFKLDPPSLSRQPSLVRTHYKSKAPLTLSPFSLRGCAWSSQAIYMARPLFKHHHQGFAVTQTGKLSRINSPLM